MQKYAVPREELLKAMDAALGDRKLSDEVLRLRGYDIPDEAMRKQAPASKEKEPPASVFGTPEEQARIREMISRERRRFAKYEDISIEELRKMMDAALGDRLLSDEVKRLRGD